MNELDVKKDVLATLDAWGIPYRIQEHPPVFTMSECEKIWQMPENAEGPKNLFLCNRQKTAYYLMILSPGTEFRTASVSKQLGVSRLSFAPAEDVEALLKLKPGAVSPLALIYDKTQQITLIVDEKLRNYEYLCFHPLANTATVILKASDFFDVFLKQTGHIPRFVS